MAGPALLREELKDRDLSPYELARILGMKCRTVRDVLRGNPDVRLRDVALIAQALGFNADVVIDKRTVLDDLVDPTEVRRPRRTKVNWR